MFDHANTMKSAQLAQRPETEIESVMTRADNAACRLHGRLDALFDRLKPVTLPVGQSTLTNGVAGAPQAVMSPLGESIRSIERQIDHATDRLESLLRDLAL